MSSSVRLNITDKKKLKKELIDSKLRKFEQELQKLYTIIEEYPFLKDFEGKFKLLKTAYKTKLETISIDDIDYERHIYIANATESEYMEKLFELKSKILIEKDRYIKVISKYKINEDVTKIEEFFEDESSELEVMLELVKNMDESEAKRISLLEHPLEIKLKEVKVIYLKLFNTQLIKEELQNKFDKFDDAEKIIAKEMLSQKIIEKKRYRKFMHHHYQNQQKEELQTIQESFESLGYKFDEDIQDNTLQYITTDDSKYKIAIRVVNGQISLVFTRLLQKGTHLSEYEKAKDVQKAKKWCSDFDKVKAVMIQNGLHIDENARIEPTLENIRYEEIEIKEFELLRDAEKLNDYMRKPD